MSSTGTRKPTAWPFHLGLSRTGVAGLTMGGGIGRLMRKHGLTIDHLSSVDPITSDVERVRATEGENADLFWGARDDVVNPQGRIHPMTNLPACPGIPPDRARLTVYPGLMHEGWDQAYSGSLGDDIYTWMLGISKR